MTVTMLMEQPAVDSASNTASHQCSRAPDPGHCDMVFGVACPDAMSTDLRKTVVDNANNTLDACLPKNRAIWTNLSLGNNAPPSGQYTPLAIIADCAQSLLTDNGANSLRPDLSSIYQQALYCFVLDGSGKLVEICYFGMSLEHKDPQDGKWKPLTVTETTRFERTHIPITLSFRFVVELP